MKLVELLARELDVWPEGAEVATEDDGGIVCFSKGPLPVFGAKYDGEWSFDQSGSIDCGGRMSILLATDHATAIVTRADWQAERARIAGGWIAHDGGECPVLRGTKVDVQYRNGQEVSGCGALTYESDSIYCAKDWGHNGTQRDIIAYRLHTETEQQQEQQEMTPCEKLGYKVGDLFAATEDSAFETGEEVRLFMDDGTSCPKFQRATGGDSWFECLDSVRKITDNRETITPSTGHIVTDDPRTMRDRIREIDRTVEALEEERASLVQRLADEGFTLIQVVGHSEPEEWKVGDLLEITGEEEGHEFEIGQVVCIVKIDHEDVSLPYECRPVEGGEEWWVNRNEAKFHSRPTA